MIIDERLELLAQGCGEGVVVVLMRRGHPRQPRQARSRASCARVRSLAATLSVGDSDAALNQRLSDELDALNVAAVGGDQREFTVRVEDAAGLVAGLSGWTWGTCAGIGMVWVREEVRRDGWERE